jgi:hypothetical protein
MKRSPQTQMSWVRFSLAVAATSVALVIAVAAAGAFAVSNALANSDLMAYGGPQNWSGKDLPPELAGLKDVPADQRFSHFKGVSVNLTDKDGKAVAIQVTPGKATTASATSLTIDGNDGAQHTYTLDAQTFTRGTPSNGQDVVVVTINNNATAKAVIATNGDWHNRGGPPFGR